MVWIPVLFICAAECFFMSAKAEYTKTKCEMVVAEALEKLKAEGAVKAAEGTCVPLTQS